MTFDHAGSHAACIGIVAGGGDLPGELATLFTQQKIPHCVAQIEGEGSHKFHAAACAQFSWGEIGKILKFFKSHHCHKLVLLGRITKRPDFTSIMGDAYTMRLLPRILSALTGGDDTLLGKVITLIENEGFQVVGIEDVAPQLLLEEGALSKQAFPKKLEEDRERGFAALRDLSRHDIGQALIIENHRIIAVEGAEGTDAMLERVVALRKEGRISAKGTPGFMIKMTKPNQDRRTDLPAIGPATLLNIKRAGLSGLVAEAGSVIVSRRDEVVALAHKHKLFLIGQKW